MQRLEKILHEGGYSLVVESEDGSIATYCGRGVSDLYRLYTKAPDRLLNARTADKVVGAGAAVLMAAGGVREYYIDVVSRSALTILNAASIKGEYRQLVDQIINRAGTGRCPLEARLDGLTDFDEMLSEVHRFVSEMTGKRCENAEE